jgi:hypothetical protein
MYELYLLAQVRYTNLRYNEQLILRQDVVIHLSMLMMRARIF